MINGLFRELRSIFLAWKQAWPYMATYKAAKQQWMQVFFEAGICSTEQLRFGLMRARQAAKDFVPSVGVFIGWGTPTAEMLGLPKLVTAHREASPTWPLWSRVLTAGPFTAALTSWI